MPDPRIIEAELRGLRAERDQIVKWLRYEYRMNAHAVAFADAIARGEHEHKIEEHRPKILPLLNGRHRLVVGNHDTCHPCHKKSEAAKRRYLAYGFVSVQTVVHMGPWLLCHLPYAGSPEHKPRYPEWRPKDEGRWLLHGHLHEQWQIRGRMINVGVDKWDYAPVHMSTLDRIRSA